MNEVPPYENHQLDIETIWAFERHETFKRFQDVVRAMQAGDKAPAVEYLRSIEAKHGREVSDEAKREVMAAFKLWIMEDRNGHTHISRKKAV